MKKLLPLFLFLLPAAVISCKKEKEVYNSFCADGAIHWGGDPAADGTGWMFQSPVDTVPLINLPTTFQKDSLQVHLCAEETNQAAGCECRSVYYYYSVTAVSLR